VRERAQISPRRLLCTFSIVVFLSIVGTDARADVIADSFMFPLAPWDRVGNEFGLTAWSSDRCGYHLAEDVTRDNETAVAAAAAGQVKLVKLKGGGYGHVVIIEHRLPDGDPAGPHVTTLYGHLRKEGLIGAGSEVAKGQTIGFLTKETFMNGGTIHLHFGIRRGRYQDFDETNDPDTNHWYYAGYTTIGLCRPPTFSGNPTDPAHGRVISQWFPPRDFIEARTAAGAVAQNDSYPLSQGATLTVSAPGVLANDTIPDGVTASVEFVTFPQHGGLTNLGGSGGFVYSPFGNFVGTDIFSYVVHLADATRGELGTSNVATVTVIVTPVEAVAMNDAYSIGQGGTLTVPAPGVLANDTVPPGVTASVEFLPPFPPGGLENLGGSGGFIYTPNPSFVGTESFSYIVHLADATRGDFGVSNVATVTVVVNGPVTLATGLSSPNLVTVDTTNVYWTESSGVKAAPLIRGDERTVSSSFSSWTATGLAVDSEFVYWGATPGFGSGGVFRAPIAGGQAAVMAFANQPYDVAIDGTFVFWAEANGGSLGSNSVRKKRLDGTGDVITLDPGGTLHGVMALDSSTVYLRRMVPSWVVGGCCIWVISKVDKNGGLVTDLTFPNTFSTLLPGAPTGIAVDGQSVYWVDDAGNLNSVAINGGDVKTLVSGLDKPTRVVADSGKLYVVASGSTPGGGAIWRVDVAAASTPMVEPLITGLNSPAGIALDSANVYWTERGTGLGDGTVRRMPKL
jgi:hypothetical protein